MERFYSHSYGTVHRGVYELGREATELFEGARERIAAFVNWDPTCSIFIRNATEAINLVAYSWGRAQRRPRRRGAHHRDGAPLEHRALAARLRGDRRDAALPVGVGGRRAVARRARRGARRAAGSSSSRSPTSRTCSARSTRSRRSPAAPARPARSRWSTARRPCRRCRSTWARSTRTSTPGPATRRSGPTTGLLHGRRELLAGDAALPRRRPHDLARRARPLDLERAALEVRGRHQRDRRGDRARRRDRLPGRRSGWSACASTSAS